MLQQHRKLVRRALAYADLAIAFLAFALSVQIRSRLDIESHIFRLDQTTQLYLLFSGLASLFVAYRLSGIYHSQRLIPAWRETVAVAVCNGWTFIVLLAVALAFRLDYTSRLQLGLFVGLNTVLTGAVHYGLRLMSRAARRRGYNFRQLLIVVGEAGHPARLAESVLHHSWWGLRIAGIALPRDRFGDPQVERSLRACGVAEDLPRVPLDEVSEFLNEHAVDEIWVEGTPTQSGAFFEIAQTASERGQSVRYVLAPDYIPGIRWEFDSLGELVTLAATRTPSDEVELLGKRALDIVVGTLTLIAVAPLMAVVALLLRFERGGNGQVLFRQERVGQNGRRFQLLKFRSMVPDAEARRAELETQNEMSGPVFKMRRDPRVTRLGAWLRRFSIDELPQLFNVLKGEMSLVGPRPPLPGEVDLYEPKQRRRLSVRPGITGLWQVSGRNDIDDFDRWVSLDLKYIDTWSLWLDLSILLRTLPAVVLASGAR